MGIVSKIIYPLAALYIGSALVTGYLDDTPRASVEPPMTQLEKELAKDARSAYGWLFIVGSDRKDCLAWNGVLITTKKDMTQKNDDCMNYRESAQEHSDMKKAGMKKYGNDAWTEAYSNHYQLR